MDTRIADVPLAGGRARALAVALAELVRYADDGVAEGCSIEIQVVIGSDGGCVVAAIAATGDFRPVTPLSASHALMRAKSLAEALGANFQRGVDTERMVFGIVLTADADPLEKDPH